MMVGGWYDRLIFDAIVYVIAVFGFVITISLIGLIVIYLLLKSRIS